MHAYIRKDSCKNTPKCPQDKTVFLKGGERVGGENRLFVCLFVFLHVTARGYQENNSKTMKTKNKKNQKYRDVKTLKSRLKLSYKCTYLHRNTNQDMKKTYCRQQH